MARWRNHCGHGNATLRSMHIVDELRAAVNDIKPSSVATGQPERVPVVQRQDVSYFGLHINCPTLLFGLNLLVPEFYI